MVILRSLGLYAALSLYAGTAAQSLQNGDVVNGTVVSIPYEWTYLLPSFEGQLFYTFANGTNTTDMSYNDVLREATQAPFISYDDEFLKMLGQNPQITLVERRSPEENFAYEGGVWIPELNVMWFTSAVSFGPTHFEQLNLTDNTVSNVTTTGASFKNPNGGYYWNGSVYWATFRDPEDYPGGVVKVDVNTLEAEFVLDSYFGLRFDDLDDFAFVTQNDTGNTFIYITNLPYAEAAYEDIEHGQLTNAVWRWDTQNMILQPVIDAGDVPSPNGVRSTLDGKTLYVTNFGGQQITGRGDIANFSSPAVYKYDIDAEGYPVNKRTFSYTRQGGADGIHVDDAGRVWTGEGEGIVVRSPAGKVLGVFNVQFFNPEHPLELPMANCGLAGDEVVILGTNYLWRVKLAQTVATVMN